jgi:subtilisin family serine protease
VNRHHPFGYIATFPVRAALAVALSGGLLGLCAPGTVAATPNDPYFSLQWGDSNRGQAIRAQDSEEVLGARVRGTPHADDRALAAWEVTTGSSSIVIGEADTGVEYGHPDLAANIWTNPGGVGGCASGTHGFNVVEPRGCDPLDEEPAIGGYGGHGTHVAGIMGAVGNNREGVAGMNWHASILPVKWLGSADGPNATEYLIRASASSSTRRRFAAPPTRLPCRTRSTCSAKTASCSSRLQATAAQTSTKRATSATHVHINVPTRSA